MDKNNIKYIKYKDLYEKNKLYWGLGIENEVYLECEKTKKVSKEYILKNKIRERYSIDYYSNYKDDFGLVHYFYHEKEDMEVPFLINSHSFTKTDKNTNPKTMYTKLSEPNPEFEGETLIETLQKHNVYFKDNPYWLFDGDTVEFATLNFFNEKLTNIINSLNNSKKVFIEKINTSFKELDIFKEFGKINIMKNNYPFGVYLTNMKNVGMFNNGTLHYNITLPTKLDNDCFIENKTEFINIHSKAIKIIQWMEPFLVAIYGSPDPLSIHDNNFSKASQRCAISRYVSIGTYDNETMIPGKILTKKVSEFGDYHWYNQYYKNNGYTKLNEIGLDINFNKHFNHGIEIRFLDHTELIDESFEFIIYLMDHILSIKNDIVNPIKCVAWNKFVARIMKDGKDYILTSYEKDIYGSLFSIKIKKDKLIDIYYEIYSILLLKFNKVKKGKYIPIGMFSKLTMETRSDILYPFLTFKNYSCFH